MGYPAPTPASLRDAPGGAPIWRSPHPTTRHPDGPKSPIVSYDASAMPYRMPGADVFVDYAGASVTGRHRDVNEDAWGAIESASVFLVADGGSGGSTTGRLAADLAITTFRRFFSGREAGLSSLEDAPMHAEP